MLTCHLQRVTFCVRQFYPLAAEDSFLDFHPVCVYDGQLWTGVFSSDESDTDHAILSYPMPDSVFLFLLTVRFDARVVPLSLTLIITDILLCLLFPRVLLSF